LVVLLPRLPATVGGETTATVLPPPVERRRLAGTLGSGLVRFELATGLTLADTHHLGRVRRRHPDPDPDQYSIDLTSRHH
jgi:hypothetical protein